MRRGELDHDIAELCMKLDEACPQYEFFYSGGFSDRALCVYRRGFVDRDQRVALIPYIEQEHDYTVTKIILQFS